MEIRKTMVPHSHKGIPFEGEPAREYIYFTVQFNNYRDVSGSSAHEVLDREEMTECECVLRLPESYSPDGEETPLILALHGAGARVCEKENMIGGLICVSHCVEAGYAALDVNGSQLHGMTMGCPEHVFALYKAYRYAIKHFNLSHRVLISGDSMGGGTAMNFANTFPGIVTALGLSYPRMNVEGVDVGDHHCIGTWEKEYAHDRVAKVFRFPDGQWKEENILGFDPFRTRSFLNSEGQRVVIPPCPIKIWQGLADEVVDPVMTQEFVDSVRRSGSYIELHMVDGVAHHQTMVIRRELLMWFDRFI